MSVVGRVAVAGGGTASGAFVGHAFDGVGDGAQDFGDGSKGEGGDATDDEGNPSFGLFDCGFDFVEHDACGFFGSGWKNPVKGRMAEKRSPAIVVNRR
jgi:hypothetical protein